MAADIPVFDEAAVKPRLPTVEHGLPGGERRPAQKAEAIDAAIVKGEVRLERGESASAVPGRVIGARSRRNGGLPSGFRRRRMPHAAATRYFRRRHARLRGASMSRFQSRTGGNWRPKIIESI